MSVPSRRLVNRLFGKPTLHAGGAGIASWGKATTLGQFRKGHSGLLAHLYGGAQSGDDWAACYFPVDEIHIPELFPTSGQAQWTWYQTAAETMGLGMIIWAHDPKDPDCRVDITQSANVAGLDKSAGWNSHELNITTDQFSYYGENITGSGLTAGTLYGWDDFQADVLFKTWTVYRVSFDWGREASGTFESVWLAEVKLNGQAVMLDPSFVEFDIKTGIGHGVETVDSAGTDQAISTVSIPCKVVIIQAQTDNTGVIAVGGAGVDATVATGTGVALYAGDVVTLEIDDLAKVYIDATVTGDGARFTFLT